MGNTFERIVTGTLEYMKNSGLKSMVLGISGGIDSSVCAVVCWEVVRREPTLEFYGVSLPCSTNERAEVGTASKIGKAFFKDGNFWEINLQETFECVGALCSEHIPNTPLSQGNIKARLRNIYLRDLAGKTGGLVIDTDNLSEHYTGFFTIHGDQGDLNPIGDLWKHEVYELAKWLISEYLTDEAQKEALRDSIALVPTDGNGVQAGGDLAQIAPSLKNYNELDDILKTYIEYTGHHTEEYLVALDELNQKYGEDTVSQVVERYRRSEFKRKPLPVKISLL